MIIFVGTLCVLEAGLLMKRRSWSIMRQPNQAAIVPISRIEPTRKAQNRCRRQDAAKVEVIPMDGGVEKCH